MRRKILVVDDDPVIRSLLVEYLSALGYEVEARDSGTSCLAYLETTAAPDLLILDLQMPDMTGLDVLARLSKSPSKTLPVVLLSANSETESAIKKTPFAMVRYVQKPFTLQAILDAVESTASTR